MATKKLFLLVNNSGDGSYNIHATMNAEWIAKRNKQYLQGELDPESAGVDGDGFHYKTLTVPAECTLKSLGITTDCADVSDDD